jgi:hypothetical protein
VSDRVLDDESLVKAATPVLTIANKQDLEVRTRTPSPMACLRRYAMRIVAICTSGVLCELSDE